MIKSKDPLRYVIFIFFGVGLLLLGIAGYIYTSRNSFAETAIKTRGVVVDFTYSGRSRGTAPVIEYADGSGKYHLYYHNVYTTPSSYDEGEKVQVLLDPKNPLNVQIEGESIVFWILFGIGAVFMAFAIGFFFLFRNG